MPVQASPVFLPPEFGGIRRQDLMQAGVRAAAKSPSRTTMASLGEQQAEGSMLDEPTVAQHHR